jgi:anti-sigma regulatory factor (Ser/Thr protein kinase)
MTYPAVASSVAAARICAATIAQEHGASEECVDGVRLAVSEAVTNAVVHAYPDGGGEVHLTATVLLGKLLVVVEDDGQGMVPGYVSPGLGFGLPLIAALADGCTLVRPSGGGVQLEMRFELEESGVSQLVA